MGNALRKKRLPAQTTSIETYVKQKEKRVIILGLDGSGKSTLLFSLKNGAPLNQTITPTIGFNLETVEFNKYTMTLYDVGGDQKIRSLWSCYFNGVPDALFFVIDASAQHRFQELKAEFLHILPDRNLRKVPLLILLNAKTPIPNENEFIDKVTKLLELSKLKENPYKVMTCNTYQVDSILSALEWITQYWKTLPSQ